MLVCLRRSVCKTVWLSLDELFASSPFLQLADFGLSEALVETSVGNGGCTHRWAAPEVLSHSKKSTKSDVWSLGATVWELLMEKYPFSQFGDGNGKEVMYQIIYSVGNGDVVR